MRHTPSILTPLIFTVLLGALFCLSAQQKPLQDHFVDTFYQTLTDFETTSPTQAIDASVPKQELPVKTMLPPPPPNYLMISQTSWQVTQLTSLLALLAILVCLIHLGWRRYHAPEQCRKRQARKELKHLLRTLAPLEKILPPLRRLMNLNPDATLTAIAQTAHEQGLTELAEGCQDTAQQRFSKHPRNDQKLRQAITKLLAMASLLILTTSAAPYHSQWQHAEALAAEGKLDQALRIFRNLNDSSSQSPELSENIATLTALTSQHQGNQLRQAWLMHADLQRKAFTHALKPDMILPLLPLLAAGMVLTVLYRRYQLTAGLALLSSLLMILCMIALAPRYRLGNTAVALPQAILYTTPDSQNPVTTLQETTEVTVETADAIVNDRCFVSTAQHSGWCPMQQLLTFHR